MTKDKIIDLIKWSISSVAIVLVTLIIDTGFRERATGIQEMQVYDKYVDIILKADNIEQRWKLCEYFSIVTPTERLRDRWKVYKDSIQDDYFTWKKSQVKDSVEIGLNNASLLGVNKSSSAKEFEKRGFESLISKDIEESIISFRQAEDSYNGYHNCYEISNYLIRNKSELSNPNSPLWNELYNKILTDWSWGLSKETKQKIKDLI